MIDATTDIRAGQKIAFVTGANGFVGSHLAKALHEQNIQVRALIRPRADRSRLKGLPIEWIEGDLDDGPALRKGVRDAEWVIHTAGRVRAPSAEAYYHANCVGTIKLLDAVQEACPNVSRFLYVSSLAAGGPSHLGRPRTESDPDTPQTSYGESKLAGERAVMARAGQFPVVSLRPPAIFGPEDTAVLGFFQAVAWHIKPSFGSQGQRLSIVHVQDLVAAIALALEHSNAVGEVFYIAENRVYELSEMVELIRAALGTWAIPIRIPRVILNSIAWTCDMGGKTFGFVPRLNRDKARDFLQTDWTCSTAKAHKLLGYRSHISFAEGARTTVAWYRERKWL